MNMDRENSPKLAVVWIDDQQSQLHKIGYVCTEDAPNEVNKILLTNLKDGYLYITNQKANKFKSLGITAQLGIKHSAYFGCSISQIGIELGLPTSTPLTQSLPIFTEVLSGVAKKLFGQYNVKVNDELKAMTALETIRNSAYPSVVESSLRVDGGLGRSDDLRFAINNSLQKLQANDFGAKNKGEIISARFPKTPYFLHLMNQSYPVSNDYTENRDFMGIRLGTDGNTVVGSEHIEGLIEYAKNYAGFVNFQVISMDSRHELYCPLGREIQPTEPRKWAALPEIIDLCNYSVIELGTGFFTKAERLPFAPPLPTEKMSFLSYVNGTVNDILTVALSFKKMNERFAHPVASYLRAYDRIMLRQNSMELVEKGYKLIGFSNSSARFSVSKQEKDRCRKAMTEVGFVPQLEGKS